MFLLCASFISKSFIFFWTVSMVMFSTFEHSVNFLYRNVIQRKKEDCSRTQQLGVTCLAGYAAGSIGSIISNPADNIVASLYNKKADSLRMVIFLMFFLLKYHVHHDFCFFTKRSSFASPGCEENRSCQVIHKKSSDQDNASGSCGDIAMAILWQH